MEANFRCAYNVSRSCRISSKVTVADCANEPFKLMKVMLDALARDPEGGFWLTGLSRTPQIVRLFPFDFVYLDDQLNIVQAVELAPEAILPRLHPDAASALILPRNSLSSNGTAQGDTLIICAQNELDQRIAELDDRIADLAPQPPIADEPEPAYAEVSTVTPASAGAVPSLPSPPLSLPISLPANPLAHGVAHTLAVTSNWQISNSTTAGPLLEPLEIEKSEAVEDLPQIVVESDETEAAEALPQHAAETAETEAAEALSNATEIPQPEIEEAIPHPIETEKTEAAEDLPQIVVETLETEAAEDLPDTTEIPQRQVAEAIQHPIETEETEAAEPAAALHPLEEELAPATEEAPNPELQITEAILLLPIAPVETAQTAEERPVPAPAGIVEVHPEEVLAQSSMSSSGADTAATLEVRKEPVSVPDESLTIFDTDLAAIFDQEMPVEFTLSAPFGAIEATTAKAERTPTPEPLDQHNLPEQISPEPLKPATETSPAPDAVREPEPERLVTPEVMPSVSPAIQPGKIQKPESGALPKSAATDGLVRQEPNKARTQGTAQPKPSDQGRKKSFGFLVKEFLNCPDPPPELRQHPRLVQQGLVAYERSAGASSPMEVRDLSPAGFYLRAQKRWQPGRVVALTLKQLGARDDEFQSRVDIKARVVRCESHGVGLLWSFPKDIQFNPWKRLNTKRSDESDIQFFIREIRLARAQGFLQRICPLASDQIRHALLERLSNKRVASAVEIALKAEKYLARNRTPGNCLAHSEVVTRVIENGSWIEDQWIRKMWAGLLVSSCTEDGSDRSTLPFLDLLARLTPMHLRILSFVCGRAVKLISEGESEATLDLYSSAEELMEAADSHSFQRVQQTVGHLSTFGLLKEASRPSYAAIDDKVKTRTTPTPMGLQMYAHCNGQR
jgi:hypothetical protein